MHQLAAHPAPVHRRAGCLPAWGLPVAHAAPAAAAGAGRRRRGIDPTGYLVSEKYDGVRAVWDGRVLRFRSGLAIAAPADFVEPIAGRAVGRRAVARPRPLRGAVGTGAAPASRCRGLAANCATWCSSCPARGGDFASRAQTHRCAGAAPGSPQLQAVEQAQAGVATGAAAPAGRGGGRRRRGPDAASRRCAPTKPGAARRC